MEEVKKDREEGKDICFYRSPSPGRPVGWAEIGEDM